MKKDDLPETAVLSLIYELGGEEEGREWIYRKEILLDGFTVQLCKDTEYKKIKKY